MKKWNGKWTRRDATHLLWRAQFGASEKDIRQALDDGIEATVERLATKQKETAEFSETSALLRQTAIDSGSIANLKAWWLYRMIYSSNPLAEKMSLFWHNHFATSNVKVRSVAHMGDQNDLIRNHATGSFRDLVRGMSRDVAMLLWLDGNANRKRHPNENFARELMELFTLGEGNYSEDDIKEAARAFTGWHVRNKKYWFNKLQHDTGSKTVFGKSGKFGGDDIIDLCLAHEACPEFLALKLLREFVKPDPATAEIAALAKNIRKHDFQMEPVLRDLFSSEIFFSPSARHALIKSPTQLVLGSYRALGCEPNLNATVEILAALGQDLFQPPTVKGWEGGRLWITSATVIQRANFAGELTGGNRFGKIAKPRTKPDQIAELLLARDLAPESMKELRNYARSSRDQGGLLHLVMSMPEFQLV